MKTKAFVFVALSSATLLSAAQNDEHNKNASYSAPRQGYQDQTNFQQTPRTIMDDEIAKSVHTVLEGNWLTHGYPDVTFDVYNGTVNLRGVVDTKEEKAKIEHAVKSQEGVKGVHSEISVGLPTANHKKPVAINTRTASSSTTTTTVPSSSSSASTTNKPASTTVTPGTKDSAVTDKDRMINQKIRERLLKWNPKGYETLVIATSNGVVTISGNVDRVEDIQKISHDAKYTDGVKSVTNQISTTRH